MTLSWGRRLRMARSTVNPPTPESKMPMGREFFMGSKAKSKKQKAKGKRQKAKVGKVSASFLLSAFCFLPFAFTFFQWRWRESNSRVAAVYEGIYILSRFACVSL